MSDPAEYEEERRLCYVGFTRAKKKLFVSNAKRRRIYGSTFNYPPSQFLLAVPSDVLETERSPENDRYAPASSASSSSSYPSYGIRTQPAMPAAKSQGQYSVGAKVIHPTFGTGVVLNRAGDEDDLKLEIFFKQPHGKKKIAVNHAKLIPL